MTQELEYHCQDVFLGYANGTLPETNIAPEIQPWKRRFLLETTIFIGAMLVLGSVN